MAELIKCPHGQILRSDSQIRSAARRGARQGDYVGCGAFILDTVFDERGGTNCSGPLDYATKNEGTRREDTVYARLKEHKNNFGTIRICDVPVIADDYNLPVCGVSKRSKCHFASGE